jgi:tetratricopeptide (TPR) repeat protein
MRAKEDRMAINGKPILLIGFILISMIFVSCASNNKSLIQRMDKSEIYANSNEFTDEIFDKKLPEMTGDEYERLGDTLLNRGKLHIAYLQYERSLEANPGNLRAEYKKGLALLLGEKSDEAIKQFNIVLEKDARFAIAYEGLGRAYFLKKEYSDAEINFQKALKLNPTLWKAYNFLGNMYDFQKRFGEAARAYESALAIKPGNGVLYNNLGISYFLSGEFKRAVRAFNRAIDLKYTKSKVYNNLGMAYANLEQYSDALQAFKQAGGNARAYNNLGCIYLKKSKFEEAIRCFEKAIEAQPGFYATANENLKKIREAQNQL